MKLYVGNLSFNTTEQQLESLFAEHGRVESANLVTDRDTGRPRGFGFVEMSDDAGRTAMAALNGKNVDGRDLTVNEARPRREGAGGGGSRSASTGSRGVW
jgi:RNA recognition motif-containing protein